METKETNLRFVTCLLARHLVCGFWGPGDLWPEVGGPTVGKVGGGGLRVLALYRVLETAAHGKEWSASPLG